VAEPRQFNLWEIFGTLQIPLFAIQTTAWNLSHYQFLLCTNSFEDLKQDLAGTSGINSLLDQDLLIVTKTDIYNIIWAWPAYDTIPTTYLATIQPLPVNYLPYSCYNIHDGGPNLNSTSSPVDFDQLQLLPKYSRNISPPNRATQQTWCWVEPPASSNDHQNPSKSISVLHPLTDLILNLLTNQNKTYNFGQAMKLPARWNPPLTCLI